MYAATATHSCLHDIRVMTSGRSQHCGARYISCTQRWVLLGRSIELLTCSVAYQLRGAVRWVDVCLDILHVRRCMSEMMGQKSRFTPSRGNQCPAKIFKPAYILLGAVALDAC